MTCTQLLRRIVRAFKRRPIRPITMHDVEPEQPDAIWEAANVNKRADLDRQVELVRQKSWQIHHQLTGDVLEHIRGGARRA